MKFVCDGTQTSVWEECSDAQCTSCAFSQANVASGGCYMLEGSPHVVSCSGTEATVRVYNGEGLDCNSELSPASFETHTHQSGSCEGHDHDHDDDHHADDHAGASHFCCVAHACAHPVWF